MIYLQAFVALWLITGVIVGLAMQVHMMLTLNSFFFSPTRIVIAAVFWPYVLYNSFKEH